MQTVFHVSARNQHTSTDSVHVSHCEPDVLELVQSFHVEGLVIIIVRFTMLLLLLLVVLTSSAIFTNLCSAAVLSAALYGTLTADLYTGCAGAVTINLF